MACKKLKWECTHLCDECKAEWVSLVWAHEGLKIELNDALTNIEGMREAIEDFRQKVLGSDVDAPDLEV